MGTAPRERVFPSTPGLCSDLRYRIFGGGGRGEGVGRRCCLKRNMRAIVCLRPLPALILSSMFALTLCSPTYFVGGVGPFI